MAENYEKVITAKTFSPGYDEVEDRIRFTINYKDLNNRVDFVITRNLIISLIPALNGYIDKYYKDDLSDTTPNSDIVTDIKSLRTKSSKNAPRSELTDNSDMELLKTDDTLLERIDLRYNVGSKNTTFVLFSQDIMVKAILDYPNFKKVTEALKSTIPSFKWGLSKSFIYE